MTVALTVPAIAVAGGDFALSGAAPSGTMLQPNQSAAFDVRFSPTAAGSRSGSLVIGNQTYALVGTGAQLTYEVDAGAGLQPLGAGPVDFGPVQLGFSVARHFAVVNQTAVVLTAPAIAVPAGDFALSGAAPGGLAHPARPERRLLCPVHSHGHGCPHRLARHWQPNLHAGWDGPAVDLRSGRGCGAPAAGRGPGGFRLGPTRVQRRAPFRGREPDSRGPDGAGHRGSGRRLRLKRRGPWRRCAPSRSERQLLCAVHSHGHGRPHRLARHWQQHLRPDRDGHRAAPAQPGPLDQPSADPERAAGSGHGHARRGIPNQRERNADARLPACLRAHGRFRHRVRVGRANGRLHRLARRYPGILRRPAHGALSRPAPRRAR